MFSSDDRHGPPAKKSKDDEKDEEEDLNDANYDEVINVLTTHCRSIWNNIWWDIRQEIT